MFVVIEEVIDFYVSRVEVDERRMLEYFVFKK